MMIAREQWYRALKLISCSVLFLVPHCVFAMKGEVQPVAPKNISDSYKKEKNKLTQESSDIDKVQNQQEKKIADMQQDVDMQRKKAEKVIKDNLGKSQTDPLAQAKINDEVRTLKDKQTSLENAQQEYNTNIEKQRADLAKKMQALDNNFQRSTQQAVQNPKVLGDVIQDTQVRMTQAQNNADVEQAIGILESAQSQLQPKSDVFNQMVEKNNPSFLKKVSDRIAQILENITKAVGQTKSKISDTLFNLKNVNNKVAQFVSSRESLPAEMTSMTFSINGKPMSLGDAFDMVDSSKLSPEELKIDLSVSSDFQKLDDTSKQQVQDAINKQIEKNEDIRLAKQLESTTVSLRSRLQQLGARIISITSVFDNLASIISPKDIATEANSILNEISQRAEKEDVGTNIERLIDRVNRLRERIQNIDVSNPEEMMLLKKIEDILPEFESQILLLREQASLAETNKTRKFEDLPAIYSNDMQGLFQGASVGEVAISVTPKDIFTMLNQGVDLGFPAEVQTRIKNELEPVQKERQKILDNQGEQSSAMENFYFGARGKIAQALSKYAAEFYGINPKDLNTISSSSFKQLREGKLAELAKIEDPTQYVVQGLIERQYRAMMDSIAARKTYAAFKDSLNADPGAKRIAKQAYDNLLKQLSSVNTLNVSQLESLLRMNLPDDIASKLREANKN